MPSALPTVIDVLDTADPLSFPDLLERLYHLRFQGEVTLHFAGGVPRAVVLAQPVSVPLLVSPLTNRRD